MKGRPRTGENKICVTCEKEYYVSGWRLKKGPSRFCSVICQNYGQYVKAKFTCFLCKKRFEDSLSRNGRRKFCSLECKSNYEIDRISCQKQKRNEKIYIARSKGIIGNTGAAIRKLIFSIKEKKCEICGYNEYECCLDIHHEDKNPNNNNIENLKILCVMCHRKVHRNII